MIQKIKNLTLTQKILSVVAILILLNLFRGIKTTSPMIASRSNDYGTLNSVSKMQPENYQTSAPLDTPRKVSVTSYYSVLVKDVTASLDTIKAQVTTLGGFTVNANISKNDGNDEGVIELRVPSAKLDELTAYLRKNSIKIISESVNGNDITDQYFDAETRLAQLETMKTKMTAILNKAEDVEDMVNVQQQIFNIQDQIDNIKGRISYMNETVETSYVSISLATDELALPYAPQNAWRPAVIFKEAVRALLGVLQALAGLAIWIVVFSPLLLATLGVYTLVKKYRANKKLIN